MKKLLFAVLFFCSIGVFADDIIFTTSKQQIICTITDITDLQVSYTRSDTPAIMRHIATENVWKIIYGNGVVEELNPQNAAAETQTAQEAGRVQVVNEAKLTANQTAQREIQQHPQANVAVVTNTTVAQASQPQPLRIVGKKDVYMGDQLLGNASLPEVLKTVPGAYEEEYKHQILKGTGIGLVTGGAIAVVPGIVFSTIGSPEYGAVFYGLGGTCLLSGIICWVASGKHRRNAINIYNRNFGYSSTLEFEPSNQGLGFVMHF